MNTMIQPVDKQNKKYLKKLREIETLKKKQNLTPDELSKIEKYTEYKKIISKNNGSSLLESIPDDIKQLILSYLPLNTRLNILRQKYPIELLTKRLSEIPKNIKMFDKFYHLVTLLEPILSEFYKKNMTDFYYTDIFCGCLTNFEYTLRMIKNQSNRYYYYKRVEAQRDISKGRNVDYYFDHFINIIIYTLKNYTRMYKKDLPDWHRTNEKIMLKVLLHILR
jgi:hypothetical protein